MTYLSDPVNHLSSVRRDGTLIARYGYDVLGRRIAKRVYSAASGGTVGYTRFVYAGSHVSFETDSAGTIGLKYVWGAGTDNLLAVRDANDVTFYAVTDKLGSVRELARRDGTWIGTLRYDPYGTAIDSAGSAMNLRYRWTGREYDAESGFYFHRARYYDPGAKRFITEDPIGYAGGGNLYSYVDGAPLEARDPAGLMKSWTDAGRGFMEMCTVHGSRLHADGSISSGGCQGGFGLAGGGGGGALGGALRLNKVYINGNFSGFVVSTPLLGANEYQLGHVIGEYVFSMGHPLTAGQRAGLGNFCTNVNCDKVVVHHIKGERAHTKGHHIYIPNPDDPSWLAHEMTHVYQWEQNPLNAILDGFITALTSWTGMYNLPSEIDTRYGFSDYTNEQQANLVATCFADAASRACQVSPFRPGGP